MLIAAMLLVQTMPAPEEAARDAAETARLNATVNGDGAARFDTQQRRNAAILAANAAAQARYDAERAAFERQTAAAAAERARWEADRAASDARLAAWTARYGPEAVAAARAAKDEAAAARKAAPASSKLTCTTEAITGSRTAAQRVCRDRYGRAVD